MTDTHRSPAQAFRRRRVQAACCLAALLGIALLSGCANKQSAAESGATTSSTEVPSAASPAPPREQMAGGYNRNGSQLAYEHEVRVRIDGPRITTSVASVREACASARFGDCTVLAEEIGAGETPTGMIQVRAAPQAVGGLVGLASQGGNVAQRSTHAEDLADAVKDNGLRRARLQLQHEKLTEIVQRKDLKVEDLITLTDRLAQLETELQGAGQEAAQQSRRIQTNLLTIHFESTGVNAASSRISESLRGLTSTWDLSIAALITIVFGAMLPFIVLASLVAFVVGRWRARRRAAASAPH